MVILVLLVTACIAFLYVSLALLKNLFRLIVLVIFVISWMHVLVFMSNVTSNIIIAITASGNMGILVSVWLTS